MVPISQGVQGHEIFSSMFQASDWSEWKSVESFAKGVVIRGPYVDAFESEFADGADIKHCVSCANGTDALYLAVIAAEIRSR